MAIKTYKKWNVTLVRSGYIPFFIFHASNSFSKEFFIHIDEYKIKNFCGEEGRSMVKRLKKAIFSVILAFVFIITMHPLEARAGEWTVDGDAKDYVYIPGGTYWGGSTSRT